MGICYRAAGSGGRCEGEQLQEVVGGADHGPFGTHFLDAPQQELAEAACLFDLSEHRFHHLLSQSVGCFEAAVVDLPAPPSLAGSSPAVSACRRPNPASRRHACLCRKSRPLRNPPPRRPPACERPRLSIPPRVASCAYNSSLYVSMRSP